MRAGGTKVNTGLRIMNQ